MSHPGEGMQAFPELSRTGSNFGNLGFRAKRPAILVARQRALSPRVARDCFRVIGSLRNLGGLPKGWRLESELAAHEEPCLKAGTLSSPGSRRLRVPITGRRLVSHAPNDPGSQPLTARRGLWRRPR